MHLASEPILLRHATRYYSIDINTIPDPHHMDTNLPPKQPLGFWKTVLASFLGFLGAHILFCLFFLFVSISLILGAVLSKNRTVTLKDNTVLRIDVASLQEIVVTDDFGSILPFGGSANPPVSLTQALQGIHKAKANPNIKGIYLNVENLSAGLASTDELREALLDFKKSGKFVIAYADNYSQKAYYLASVADRVVLNPEGMIPLVGIASGTLMMHEALEKLGIKAEVFKVGTYKGAVEPYILDRLSEPNREQIRAYISGAWEHILSGIATARNLSVDSIRAFAEGGHAFDAAQTYLRSRLVDTLAYRLDMEEVVARELGVSSPSKIHQVTLNELISLPDAPDEPMGDNEVTVLYAEGEIMDSPYSQEGIQSALAEQLKRLGEAGTSTKALVLRINSPGGSAFLSEQIWHQLRELKRKFPVVVSMGDVAASGGYYIASAADAIVASPMTVTGSIGIFGIVPEASVLAKRLGLSMDVVKTSPYADLEIGGIFGLGINGLSPEQKAVIQGIVERGYRTFLSRVAEGRSISIDSADHVGQGRVWLGEQAKALGLVDELGGLQTAIKLAAKLANISGDYYVHYGTTSHSFWDQLFGSPTTEGFVARLRDRLMTEQERRLQQFLRQSFTYTGILARLPYGLPAL